MADRRRWAWAGLVALVALLVSPAAATTATAATGQIGSERITSYAVDIKVENTGSLLITETIDYDFGFSPHHGIYRDVPVRLDYNSRYERIYPLHVLSVQGSPGTPDKYALEVNNAFKRIKIGDAKKTITGAHRYTIAYRVGSALNGFDDHDELYWNAIGNEWSVPIERATVHVTTPSGITDVACFGGGTGSRLACDTAAAE